MTSMKTNVNLTTHARHTDLMSGSILDSTQALRLRWFDSKYAIYWDGVGEIDYGSIKNVVQCASEVGCIRNQVSKMFCRAMSWFWQLMASIFVYGVVSNFFSAFSNVCYFIIARFFGRAIRYCPRLLRKFTFSEKFTILRLSKNHILS